MQNNFEKQVQQKMDELSFVPTEPVWKKIEEQIRQKKDRSKLIIWLPILLLLLAGGFWWLNSTRTNQNNLAQSVAEKENSPASKNFPIDHQPENKNSVDISSDQNQDQQIQQKIQDGQSKKQGNENALITTEPAKNKSSFPGNHSD